MAETPQSLLQRLRHQPDDGAAWGQLLALYAPFLQLWLRRLSDLKNQDAEDVIQNVLTTVVRKLPEFEHNQRPGAFRAWLKTTLVHCLQEHRRARPPIAVGGEEAWARLQELEDDESDLSRRFDQEQRAHVFRRLVELGKSHFPPLTWELFERVVLAEQAPANVAADTNVSVNTVYLAKSRVLSWLRQEGQGLVEDQDYS